MPKWVIFNKIKDPHWRNPHNWIDITVPDEELERYNTYKNIILEFYEKGGLSDIASKYDMTYQNCYKVINRCLELDPDGIPLGFAALRKHLHIKDYERTSDSELGYAGKFTKFLDEYPKIREQIRALVLSKKVYVLDEDDKQLLIKTEGGHETEKRLVEWFDEICASNGVMQHEYPRCLDSKGMSGLRGEIKRIDKEYEEEAAYAYGGKDSLNQSLANQTKEPDEARDRETRPFVTVECDAHYMDLMMVVLIETLEGIIKPILITRCWLYVIIDVASRSILGYHLSLNAKSTSEDFLQCMKNSLIPWKPMDLTIPGLFYPEGSGLPSGVIESCAWRKFRLIKLDNDNIHLSPWNKRKLSETIGCAIGLGKVGVPTVRSVIERLFKKLESLGWHRLGSSTGSNPRDPKRHNPGSYAKKHKISFDEIEQVLDVVIATMNIHQTRSAPLYNDSPLNYLENYHLTEPQIITAVKPALREHLPFLIDPIEVTIRGSKKNRVHPYIQWESAIYKHKSLHGAWGLIGESATMMLDRENVAFAPVILNKSGELLGKFLAQPPWHKPHSDRTRKKIIVQTRRGEFHLGRDAIISYEHHLASNMESSARTAKEMKRVMEEKPGNTEKGTIEAPIKTQRHTPSNDDFKPNKNHWIEMNNVRASKNRAR